MMRHRFMRVPARHSLVFAAILMAAWVSRARAVGPAEHVRGTVVSIDAGAIVVATANGSVRVQLAPATGFATVVRSDREHISEGSFLGIASVTAPDGSQRATEVTIFPESLRGTGEGQVDWDLPGTATASKMTNGTAASSKMTNGTVSGGKMTNGTATGSKMTNGTVSGAPVGSLTLQFKDGEQNRSQTLTIPADIPVVAVAPGQAVDVQRGAHAVVFAHRDPGGTLTADRVIVGKNGVVPPM
jgi:hypothetical protein